MHVNPRMRRLILTYMRKIYIYICFMLYLYTSRIFVCMYTLYTVNTNLSAAIYFQGIWWITEFGRLSGYSLVLVHYILVLRNCGGLKGLAD